MKGLRVPLLIFTSWIYIWAWEDVANQKLAAVASVWKWESRVPRKWYPLGGSMLHFGQMHQNIWIQRTAERKRWRGEPHCSKFQQAELLRKFQAMLQSVRQGTDQHWLREEWEKEWDVKKALVECEFCNFTCYIPQHSHGNQQIWPVPCWTDGTIVWNFFRRSTCRNSIKFFFFPYPRFK